MSSPSRTILKFLRWFCDPELFPYIEGDLNELYTEKLNNQGKRKAQWFYFIQVIRLFRPGIVRTPQLQPQHNQYTMLKNNFKIAFRHFGQEKTFTLINLIGLSVGLLATLVIASVIQFELSFDDFHTKRDRIYRVLSGDPDSPMTEYGAAVPQGIRTIFEEEFPEIEKTVLVYQPGSEVKIDHELFELENTFYVTPSFFEVFDYTWKSGNPATALSDPNQAVVNARIERDLFDGEAMGKSIIVNNQFELMITGVVDEFPENSEFDFEIAMSYKTFEGSRFHKPKYEGNAMSAHQTYVLLKQGVDPEQVNSRFPDMIARHISPEYAEKYMTHMLQPLQQVHFDEGIGSDNYSYFTSIKTLKNMGFITLLVLLAACINYVNLSTGNAIRRSKEVGIRKVIGGTRKQLISQFLVESVILTLTAGIVAIGLAALVIPYVSEYLNTALSIHQLFKFDFIFYYLISLLFISLLAGFYPALRITRFKPLSMIRPIASPQSGGLTIRRGLAILQMSLSQILIIGAIVTSLQLYQFNHVDIGFEKEAIVAIPIPIGKATEPALETLLHTMRQHPEIIEVSAGLAPPSSYDNKWWTSIEHRSSDESIEVQHKSIHENYLDFYKLELLAGQNVTIHDSIQTVVINESMMKLLGFTDPESVLGETIDFWNYKKVPVVGVVKDFVSTSLKDEIPPLFFWHQKRIYRELFAKINMTKSRDALYSIKQDWEETYPDRYFKAQFIDQLIARYYQNEQKQSNVILALTGIAILINCLGLFGMINFLSNQRTKEMGIRKVLGASFQELVMLLGREFILLLFISCIIAVPLGYYAMSEWLADFNYRITLSWWIFGISIVIGFLLMLIAIGFKSIRTAQVNPIESLRDE